MNWKIGQKLVVVDADWQGTLKLSPSLGPQVGDVVTIGGFIDTRGLWLIEYGEFWKFLHYHFRPLLGDSAKSELISSFKEITETSDMPIREPNPQLA